MLRPIACSVLVGLSLPAYGAAPDAQAPVPREAALPPAEGKDQLEPWSPIQSVDDANGPLDKARAGVRYATEWLVRGIDGWFGDKPFEDGGKLAGRIGLRATWRQDEGLDWLTRFSIRVDPPNLREKAFVFIGRDNEREVVTDRPEAFTRREQLLQETRDEQSFFAGVGTQLADVITLRAGFRGGLKPYAQARLREQWQFGQRDQFEFKETLFWTADDGFGSTTALAYDHLFNLSLALRWQSAATWSQESEGVEWGSSVGLYRTFGFQQQLSLEAVVNGETGGDAEVSEYGIRTRWEQPVYKDWLLAEVLVGYFWPRKDSITERGRTWAVGAGLQMRF